MIPHNRSVLTWILPSYFQPFYNEWNFSKKDNKIFGNIAHQDITTLLKLIIPVIQYFGLSHILVDEPWKIYEVTRTVRLQVFSSIYSHRSIYSLLYRSRALYWSISSSLSLYLLCSQMLQEYPPSCVYFLQRKRVTYHPFGSGRGVPCQGISFQPSFLPFSRTANGILPLFSFHFVPFTLIWSLKNAELVMAPLLGKDIRAMFGRKCHFRFSIWNVFSSNWSIFPEYDLMFFLTLSTWCPRFCSRSRLTSCV